MRAWVARSCTRVRRSGRAFTAIELLVVIAIILLLASLLLPALHRARTTADSAVCKNHLRQWGIALSLYVDEHGVYVPGMMNSADNGELDIAWPARLRPYPGAEVERVPGSAKGMDWCPSYVRLRGLVATPVSYAYNASGYYAGSAEHLGLSGEFLRLPAPNEGTPSDCLRLIREDQVVHPSEMLAIGDAPLRGFGASTSQGKFMGHPVLGFPPTLEEMWGELGVAPCPVASAAASGRDLPWMRRRHAGKWNLVFCDSHVEGLNFRKLFDPMNDEVLRRWHRDGLPHRERLWPPLR